MSLTDGDVALLARQAVDLFDPELEITIEPGDPVDPYRFGEASWLVVAGPVTVRVAAEDGAAETVAGIIDQLAEHGQDPQQPGGRAFPPCPGHLHPARVAVEGLDVVLRCPQTGAVVGRIRPELPG